MARFKKAARRYFGRSKGRRSNSKGSGMSVEKLAIGSALYGAARPYAINILPDLPQLGGYSDNILLGVGGYLAAKKGSGMIKTAGMVVLANEAFIAGNKLTSGGQISNSTIYI